MKCTFCGTAIERGTGKMLVKNDGKILYFCSRSCEKQMLKLGRKPRNVRWTEEARKIKQGDKQ
ncbi:50S ribosomal protein L24e [Candidatus Woesearchaeota archaeon]|nr:50S ribosomal protein L24e [Candidatus Woesearchaeota archaeon]